MSNYEIVNMVIRRNKKFNPHIPACIFDRQGFLPSAGYASGIIKTNLLYPQVRHEDSVT